MTTVHEDDLIEVADRLSPSEMRSVAIGLLEVTQVHRVLGITHPRGRRARGRAATPTGTLVSLLVGGGCDPRRGTAKGDRSRDSLCGGGRRVLAAPFGGVIGQVPARAALWRWNGR